MDANAERTPVEEVLERLGNVKAVGDEWDAFCPAHGDDHNRHLHIAEAEDGRVLAHCHKGCTFLQIFDALGLEPKDAFPKARRNGKDRDYYIRDHRGRLDAIHVRQELPNGKKSFQWRGPDGSMGLGGRKAETLALYGAEAISSVPPDTPIILTEGEKAASGLTHHGIPAVATVTGAAQTPTVDVLKVLAKRCVVLWPDADDDGRKHMRRIARLLKDLSCDVRWFEYPDALPKDDAADHPSIKSGDTDNLKRELYTATRFAAQHDPSTDGASSFEYVLEDYRKLRELRRTNGGITGIRTGLASVDRGLRGLNRGYTYLIAARTSVGKSVLAGQIALTAAQCGHRVLLQSVEMSALQMMDRFACRIANVDYFKAAEGKTSADEEAKLDGAAELLGTVIPLVIDDWNGSDVSRIRENIERHEPELVVIDYLQYVVPKDTSSSTYQQVTQLSRDLNSLKGEYNIPVVLAAQLNRNVEYRGGDKGEPMLSDLRDSGAIEQDADVVMMLHRPDKNNDVKAEDEDILILCRKNRMGELWRVTARFVPGQQWISDERRYNVVGQVS